MTPNQSGSNGAGVLGADLRTQKMKGATTEIKVRIAAAISIFLSFLAPSVASAQEGASAGSWSGGGASGSISFQTDARRGQFTCTMSGGGGVSIEGVIVSASLSQSSCIGIYDSRSGAINGAFVGTQTNTMNIPGVGPFTDVGPVALAIAGNLGATGGSGTLNADGDVYSWSTGLTPAGLRYVELQGELKAMQMYGSDLELRNRDQIQRTVDELGTMVDRGDLTMSASDFMAQLDDPYVAEEVAFEWARNRACSVGLSETADIEDIAKGLLELAAQKRSDGGSQWEDVHPGVVGGQGRSATVSGCTGGIL